jgi:hypothetical protein
MPHCIDMPQEETVAACKTSKAITIDQVPPALRAS